MLGLQSCIILLSFLYPILAFGIDEAAKNGDRKHLIEILQISTDPEVGANILFADKSERKVYVFESTGKLKEQYEIDIGKNDGNKTKQDDKKTPEGIYLLEKRLTQPEIPFDLYGSLAITTNYPNVFDRFEKKTGHGIWLHSVPDTVPLTRGSRGCVVVRNDHIKKIADMVSLDKSYLIINDRARWVDEKEHAALKSEVENWIEDWRSIWEKQDLERYKMKYSKDFSAPGFNLSSWMAHKKRLKNIYKQINIEFGSANIFHQKNQFLVKFRQQYKSDQHEDVGIKTLFIIKENNELKILREEWTGLDQQSVADKSSDRSSIAEKNDQQN